MRSTTPGTASRITANDTRQQRRGFLRTDQRYRAILCVINFTPVFHPIYRIGLPFGGTLREIFNTDRAEYGGSNQYNAYELSAQPGEFNGFPFWTEICVPPLSCVYFTYEKILPPPAGKRGLGTLAEPVRRGRGLAMTNALDLHSFASKAESR